MESRWVGNVGRFNKKKGTFAHLSQLFHQRSATTICKEYLATLETWESGQILFRQHFPGPVTAHWGYRVYSGKPSGLLSVK